MVYQRWPDCTVSGVGRGGGLKFSGLVHPAISYREGGERESRSPSSWLPLCKRGGGDGYSPPLFAAVVPSSRLKDTIGVQRNTKLTGFAGDNGGEKSFGYTYSQCHPRPFSLQSLRLPRTPRLCTFSRQNSPDKHINFATSFLGLRSPAYGLLLWCLAE